MRYREEPGYFSSASERAADLRAHRSGYHTSWCPGRDSTDFAELCASCRDALDKLAEAEQARRARAEKAVDDAWERTNERYPR